MGSGAKSHRSPLSERLEQAKIIWDHFEIRDDVSMNILIFLAGISRTVACRRQITKLFCPV